jgi:nicotinamide-nucleotide amidase
MTQALPPRAFIVSQGEEILTGLVIDTNANFLCGRLTDLGLRVRGVVTAGDRIEEIAAALRSATIQSEVVVCTGGLGPTDDDLTAEAAALAFQRPLEFHPEAMAQIEQRFAAIGRQAAASDRRQAMLPAGARLIPNALGTAPGFTLEASPGHHLWCLPGVPSEMKPMWHEFVADDARSLFSITEPLRRLFRVMGRGESRLQDLLGDLPGRFPGIELGFRAHMPENQVKLVAEPAAAQSLDAAVAEVRQRLGKDLFSEEEDVGLAEVVGRMLLQRGERLALAESCTGGLIGHRCVSVAGSSQWLERGFITYSNNAKMENLGVAAATLRELGAVSEETALEMAAGARRAAGADWGVAVTGISGPSGGSADKPVGTTCFAVDGPTGTRSRTLRFGRDRNSNRSWAAAIALDLLRRQLLRAGQ